MLKAFLLAIAFTALAAITTLPPLQAAPFSPTRTPAVGTPAFAAYEALIKDGLQNVPQVQLVEATDNRKANGKRIITITYETAATTARQRVDEWMTIILPVGQTIQVHQLDVDQLDLAGVTKAGETVGVFSATAPDLADFIGKRITRAQFLDRAKYKAIAPLAPTPTVRPVQPTRPATRFTGKWTLYRDKSAIDDSEIVSVAVVANEQIVDTFIVLLSVSCLKGQMFVTVSGDAALDPDTSIIVRFDREKAYSVTATFSSFKYDFAVLNDPEAIIQALQTHRTLTAALPTLAFGQQIVTFDIGGLTDAIVPVRAACS